MEEKWKYNISINYIHWGRQDTVKVQSIDGKMKPLSPIQEMQAAEIAKKKAAETKKLLNAIEKTQTGKIVLVSIKGTGKKITIEGSFRYSNANTVPKNNNWIDATQRSKRVLKPSKCETTNNEDIRVAS